MRKPDFIIRQASKSYTVSLLLPFGFAFCLLPSDRRSVVHLWFLFSLGKLHGMGLARDVARREHSDQWQSADHR
jgi:hypothetical protein